MINRVFSFSSIYLIILVSVIFILNLYLDINSERIITYLHKYNLDIYDAYFPFLIFKSFAISIFMVLFIYYFYKRMFSSLIKNKISIQKRLNDYELTLNYSSKLFDETILLSTSDLSGNIISVSKALEELSGYSQDELIGKNHSIFKSEDTNKEFYTNLWNTINNNQQFIGELKNKSKSGKYYWIKVSIDSIYNDIGEKIGYSSYQENITDKKRLEYLSSHDTLTGVYNRGEFKKELKIKIKSNRRYNQTFGLIMIDIDYFKSINDTYGHKIGDDVLVALSLCIKESLREDDFFARWGGEEFVLIANFRKIKDLVGLVRKLQSSIKELDLIPVPHLTVSFGLTLFNENDDEESIQKRADDALYKAKRNGRDRYEIIEYKN